MSRAIASKASVSMTDEERALKRTENGKLLFTAYQNRNCAMLIQNDRLVSVSVLSDTPSKIGAIYVGKIKNITKNINACFVEIEKKELCYLPFQSATSPYLLNRPYDGRLLEGDDLLVQVERDAQKTKQASVSARISIASDYFGVTLIGTNGINSSIHREKKNNSSGNIRYSSKLTAGQKESIQNTLIENNYLVNNRFTLSEEDLVHVEAELLIRTKAEECCEEELLLHLKQLIEEFKHILSISRYRSCFSCIKEAPGNYERILSRFSQDDFQEIVTDQQETFDYLNTLKEKGNALKAEIRLYQDKKLSLSALYGLASKMEMALERRIWLKSGGYLVIEPTEALTVIDVNTGKYEAKKNADETFRLINLEAAAEIATQLKLRNMSGIILVDFINMKSKEHQQELLNYLKQLVKLDKIKTVVVDITPLGLVEITRKKVNKPLWEEFYGN